MDKQLHIISFNIPDPPNYGGVIGVFYHLKALHKLGVKIILHCFEYGRSRSEELEQYCESVYYYKRDMSIWRQFSLLPFIVRSRMHPELYQRLQADQHPILLEGTHVCGYLADPVFKDRLQIVRMHNIEWKYYQNFAGQEKNLIKKLFFYIEYKKLKHFELKVIAKHADHMLAVSPRETAYLKTMHNNVHYVAAFHANEEITSLKGSGKYVIYHGDLSVYDNEKAALYLIEKVFAHIDTPFIVAGLNPTEQLKETAKLYDNVTIRPNLPRAEMDRLIREAHINLLVTFNAAGMKLKLLNALYAGRFCLVNDPMVLETGMEPACLIENSPEGFRKSVQTLMAQSFDKEQIEKRAKILGTSFSNLNNAKVTLSILENEDLAN